MKYIPKGLCQCGCGKKTRLAPQSHTKLGWVKGEPIKFFRGHHPPNLKGTESPHWKGGKYRANTGYVYVYQPENPRAMKNGYVSEAVLIAESVLGNYLPPGAEVHHGNRVRNDNRPKNLVVCQDRAYHMLLHRRQRALAACGHANWRVCGYCLKYDAPENLYIRGPVAHHRECKLKAERNRRYIKNALLEARARDNLALVGGEQKVLEGK